MTRAATLADVEAIVAMGERFRRQSAYHVRVAANPAQVRALATSLITSPDGVVFVADAPTASSEARVVGMLALVVYDHFLDAARVCGEIVWWVDPLHRGRAGLQLLRAGERWARAAGATRLDMIAPTPEVERIYERLGYAPVERMYQRRL